MRFFSVLLVTALLILTGCSSVEVHTDFDSTADFSKIRKYYWQKIPTTKNPLMADRIVAEIDAQLEARGWQRVSQDKADVAIAAHVTSHEEERIDTMYNNMGPGWYGPAGGVGGWGWAGAGMSTSTVSFYEVGTLIVDIFDIQNHHAIWHGTAEATVDDDAQKQEANVREAALKLFKDFPPGRKASR